MSEAAAAAEVIDTGAEVSVPDGEVSREDLVKILQDANDAEPSETEADAAESSKVEAPKPDPAAERVSARIIAANRAERRAAAERQQAARARAEIEAGKAAVADHVRIAEQVKAAKLSPSKALELLGMDAKTFLETLANEHEPELVAKRAMTAEQAEREKLAAEVAELKQNLLHRERAARQQADQQAYYHVQEQFIGHVAAQPESYPHLVEEFTPQEIAERGWQVATKHAAAYKAQFGDYPDDSVIAEYLEGEAKARAEARAAWRERIGKTAPTPSQGRLVNQGQPVKANTPRTLTNGASSTKATASKPWSQKDADEESKRILAQAFAQASDD